jgi:hypothetical protein
MQNKAENTMKQALAKQLKNIEKQEKKLFNPKENTFIKTKITPVVDMIQDKIPDKLKLTLDTAFYKGFQLVFKKGNAYIEKTYNKDKIKLEHDLNNYAVEKYKSVRHIKKLDQQSNLSKTINSSIAVVEGGVLGFLGIGLPDIPLFISVILRTVNEITLRYGYSYDTDEEKAYILTLICGAITQGDRQQEWNEKAEALGAQIDSGLVWDIDLDSYIKETSNVLSDALLTAKFIQGIPFVGVIGGVVNHSIISRIGKYAGIKYKKRYLLHKVKEQA